MKGKGGKILTTGYLFIVKRLSLKMMPWNHCAKKLLIRIG